MKYDVAVIIVDDIAETYAFILARKLRSIGLRVDIPIANQIGKKLKRASSIGCSISFIVGETEINSGLIQLKIMASGEQKQIIKSEVLSFSKQYFNVNTKEIQ